MFDIKKYNQEIKTFSNIITFFECAEKNEFEEGLKFVKDNISIFKDKKIYKNKKNVFLFQFLSTLKYGKKYKKEIAEIKELMSFNKEKKEKTNIDYKNYEISNDINEINREK